MIDRLADDHANARRLAEGMADLDGIRSPGGLAQPGDDERLDPGRVATNFVLFKVERDHAEFLGALRERGVLMVEYFHGQIRAATHHDIHADDIDTTIGVVRDVLDGDPPGARPGRRDGLTGTGDPRPDVIATPGPGLPGDSTDP